MRPCRSLFVALLLCALPGMRAQTITASLGGTVLDQSGGAVPNARIHVVNTNTNVETVLVGGALGEFLAPSLQPGPYTVRVEAPGFKVAQRTGLVLDVAQAARIEMRLEVGTVNETVEVNSVSPLLSTADSSGGQVVDSRNIMNLPLNTRIAYNLVLLAPGVHGGVG